MSAALARELAAWCPTLRITEHTPAGVAVRCDVHGHACVRHWELRFRDGTHVRLWPRRVVSDAELEAGARRLARLSDAEIAAALPPDAEA